jgi:hypothetical protein
MRGKSKKCGKKDDRALTRPKSIKMMSIPSKSSEQPTSMSYNGGYSLQEQNSTVTPSLQDLSESRDNDSENVELKMEPQHCSLVYHHLKPATTHDLAGLASTKSLYSLTASSTTSSADESSSFAPVQERPVDKFTTFGIDLRRQTRGTPKVPPFDKGVRECMESHLRRARLQRDKVRNRTSLEVHASIASSVGVPYTRLRSERPFLFDMHTHPMHEILAETLRVKDLTKLHQHDDLQQLMEPLSTREGRRRFQESYDSFVTSLCIPLLHSLAMAKNIFHSRASHSSSRINYRYQAFPSIRVVRPGDASDGPQCDTSKGHSIGCLRFHIPLTPSFGTNALFTESHPGREDWHPLVAKSGGLGFLFDGARCLHFSMENTTDVTCVSLEFTIAMYRDSDDSCFQVDGDGLCSKELLEDSFSQGAPGFYDEAVIDTRLGSPTWQIVAKKYGNHLLDPDYRVGFPFS